MVSVFDSNMQLHWSWRCRCSYKSVCFM